MILRLKTILLTVSYLLWYVSWLCPAPLTWVRIPQGGSLFIIINVCVLIACLIILCSFFEMFLVILVQFFTQLKFRITLSSVENTSKILIGKLLNYNLIWGEWSSLKYLTFPPRNLVWLSIYSNVLLYHSVKCYSSLYSRFKFFFSAPLVLTGNCWDIYFLKYCWILIL